MCSKLAFNDNIAHPDRTLPFHDLVYVISGGFNVIVENELIESREGDIMFLPAHKHHYPNSNNLKNSSCYYIHFSCDIKDYVIFKKPDNIIESYYCIPSKLNLRDNHKSLYYFNELSLLCNMGNESNSKLASSILSRILSEIDLQFNITDHLQYNQLTKDIISILEENLQDKITIEDLSKSLNFAPRTLQKHFKTSTGKSIHDYYLELKLNNSKYFLISYPHMKLKEIAIMFGFYDEFHYSKAFKKLFNISPNNYRRQNV
ncbi:AraC family transcriptional regulator [Clostridium folliculivorans]|nr:AraC family transcriptional regulator [Clostridium folliculivorans]